MKLQKLNQHGIAPVVILAILGVVGIGGFGTAVVSDSARPGDTLYPIDQTVESIQGLLATSPKAQAKLEAKFSTERLDEAESLTISNGQSKHIEDALARFEKHLTHAAGKAAQAKSQSNNVDDIQEIITNNALRHQDKMLGVYDRVPEQAKPAIEKAIEMSQKGYSTALEAVSKTKKQELMDKHEAKMAELEEKLENKGLGKGTNNRNNDKSEELNGVPKADEENDPSENETNSNTTE